MAVYPALPTSVPSLESQSYTNGGASFFLPTSNTGCRKSGTPWWCIHINTVFITQYHTSYIHSSRKLRFTKFSRESSTLQPRICTAKGARYATTNNAKEALSYEIYTETYGYPIDYVCMYGYVCIYIYTCIYTYR